MWSLSTWSSRNPDVEVVCYFHRSQCCILRLGKAPLAQCCLKPMHRRDSVLPFRKGKTPVLQTLKERHFPGLFDVLEAEGMSEADIVVVSEQFFAALFGQLPSSSMTQTRYNLYIRKQGKPMRMMLLPPMHVNIFLHEMG